MLALKDKILFHSGSLWAWPVIRHYPLGNMKSFWAYLILKQVVDAWNDPEMAEV